MHEQIKIHSLHGAICIWLFYNWLFCKGEIILMALQKFMLLWLAGFIVMFSSVSFTIDDLEFWIVIPIGLTMVLVGLIGQREKWKRND